MGDTHTCTPVGNRRRKTKQEQHVNEKPNKTILQLWPKHYCCSFFFFSFFSAESRENQSMERHGRAATATPAATPAEAAQHRGRTKFNEIQENAGKQRR